ncbi:MAG TPA: hypothetical protein VIV60_22435 [Polyangiaceae bacterium]
MNSSKVSHAPVAPAGYLILNTVPTTLALPARGVLGIERATAGDVDSPLSLSALLPVQFSLSEPTWALRVGNNSQSIQLLVSGTVRIEYLRAESLLSMLSLNYSGFERFSEVVLANGRPFALVVNIGALFQAHRELGQ